MLRQLPIYNKKTQQLRYVTVSAGQLLILDKDDEIYWELAYLDLSKIFLGLLKEYRKIPLWFIALNTFIRRLHNDR